MTKEETRNHLLWLPGQRWSEPVLEAKLFLKTTQSEKTTSMCSSKLKLKGRMTSLSGDSVSFGVRECPLFGGRGGMRRGKVTFPRTAYVDLCRSACSQARFHLKKRRRVVAFVDNILVTWSRRCPCLEGELKTLTSGARSPSDGASMSINFLSQPFPA